MEFYEPETEIEENIEKKYSISIFEEEYELSMKLYEGILLFKLQQKDIIDEYYYKSKFDLQTINKILLTSYQRMKEVFDFFNAILNEGRVNLIKPKYKDIINLNFTNITQNAENNLELIKNKATKDEMYSIFFEEINSLKKKLKSKNEENEKKIKEYVDIKIEETKQECKKIIEEKIKEKDNEIKKLNDIINQLRQEIPKQLNNNDKNEKIDEKEKHVVKPVINHIKKKKNKKLNVPTQIEDNSIKIQFDSKKVDKEIDIKNSKFFTIDNIIIKNIGNSSYKNLYLIKDEITSSKFINFSFNSKVIDKFELPLKEELKPNDTYSATTLLSITNAKHEQKYKMVFYVREKGADKNLSEAYEINIKITDFEQERNVKANKIYEEIKKEYPNNEQLLNKNEIINKLLNNNFNKNEIKNEINNKIKALKIYDDLRLYYKNHIDRNEALNIIIEKNFDKKKIKEFIDGKERRIEAERIYNKLIKFDDVDFSGLSKDEILNKIQSELSLDEVVVRNFFTKDKVKVKKIYDELEDEFGISGFMDEEYAKDKIRELKYDREKINQWVENILLNGE